MDPQELERLCGQSRRKEIVAFTLSFYAACVITFGLQLYSKAKLRGGLAADDYVATGSLLCGVIGVALVMKWQEVGLGLHVFCMSPVMAQRTLQWNLAAQIDSVVGVCLLKIAVCLRVLQLLKRVSQLIRAFFWTLITLIILTHLSETIVLFFACMPLRAVWEAGVKGKCISHHDLYLATYIHVGLDAFTDLVCSWLPVFVIVRLQMRLRSKIALCVLMSLSSITAIAAIVKAAKIPSLWQKDFTWETVPLVMWTVVEHGLGLILASIPSTKPAFDKMIGTIRSRATARAMTSTPLDKSRPPTRKNRQRFAISISTVWRDSSDKVAQNWDYQDKPLPQIRVQSEEMSKVGDDQESQVLGREIESEGSSTLGVSGSQEGAYDTHWIIPRSKFIVETGSDAHVRSDTPVMYDVRYSGLPTEIAIHLALCQGMTDYV